MEEVDEGEVEWSVSESLIFVSDGVVDDICEVE